MHYHYFTLEQRASLEREMRSSLMDPELGPALERLHSAAYGVCEACGADIAFRRLQTDPLVRRCPNCS
jgi:RNA polymerase-binding transcription factor DksA